MTVFTRKSEYKVAPKLDVPRIVAFLLHVPCIPVLFYHILYNGFGMEFLSKYATTFEPLSEERKRLYMILSTFYAIRWSIGMIIMMGDVNLQTAITVGILHIVFHELPYIILSMTGGPFGIGARPPDSLSIRDYIAASFMILAGFLQHYSEYQRYVFKLDPKNKGHIHTNGLFKYARGINHTGHILRDFASCLFVPTISNPFLWFYILGDYDLAFHIVPETVQHMKNKYGKEYTKYEQSTPYLFIPGIY